MLGSVLNSGGARDGIVCVLFSLFIYSLAPLHGSETDVLTPAKVGQVEVEGGFWGPRLETNAAVTLPNNYDFIEKTGRMKNFDRAAGIDESAYQGGIPHGSDVFKILEGAAYSLQTHPELVDEGYYQRQVARVLAAQQADGFLCNKLVVAPPHGRWENLRYSHVLYNAGHLFEAAVAHEAATGESHFLEAAERYADLIDDTFGPDKIELVPGHQEIELALVKLYRATGERRYLELSDFFVNQRGRTLPEGEIYPRHMDYNQNRVPLKEETHIVGHSVRAGYTYAAMADLEMLIDDAGYGPALQRLWQDMVGSKMYITGGTAVAQYYDEGSGDPYHLPNESAYCETCGTIANVLWSHRMGLLHQTSEYFDILERALYNGVLSGISLSGDQYFYANRQATRVGTKRSPSFTPACCQSNLVRVIPQVGAMAYAQQAEDLYVNLFVAGRAELGDWTVRVDTAYPWKGKIKIEIEKAPAEPSRLALRIPGWAREQPVPSELYHFAKPSNEAYTIWVNSEIKDQEEDSGYWQLTKEWKTGDVIELNLPMPIRRVLANDRVAANVGRVALQRGPLVYCVEQIDNGGLRTNSLVLEDSAALKSEWREDLLGGIMLIQAEASALHEPEWGKAYALEPMRLSAIPYFAWANRERGTMDIWLARQAEFATALPATTAGQSAEVSSSSTHRRQSLAVVNDGIWGPRSNYRYTQRLVLSGDSGSQQWLQYEWPEARELSRAAVFWAVDHRSQVYWWKRIRGEDLGVPESWRILYLDGGEWKPVQPHPSPFSVFPYTLRLDLFNTVVFDPVTTSAIRLEATLGVAPCAVQEFRVGYRDKDLKTPGGGAGSDGNGFDPKNL
ncbi:MAG: glycoside hydrolase family 127 protein [Opitutales bacterium]